MEVLVLMVSMIFILRESAALEDEGLVIGERMMYVQPSTVRGTVAVLIMMSCERSDILLRPKPSELV